MKYIKQTQGQKASLRLGGFVILAAVMQVSSHFIHGGITQADAWMTLLTCVMTVVLYQIAKNKKYSQYVIMFITIYLNTIGVLYFIINFVDSNVPFSSSIILLVVVVYSYHQAGFLLGINFLWSMLAINVTATIWPVLFLPSMLTEFEAPLVVIGGYLFAAAVVTSLIQGKDHEKREVNYKLELNSTQEQLKANQAKLTDKEVLIAKQQEQLVGSQMQLAHAQSQISTLQQQITACHTQQRNDHKQLRAYEAEIATLKKDLEAKQAKIEHQQSQLTQSKQTLARTEQRLSNRLERITEIETQLEKLMQALFNQEVEKVYGVIVHKPKPFKHGEGQTLFWIESERRGKLPVCYPLPVEQALEQGLEAGKRVQAIGSIMGFTISVAHTFVVLMAWDVFTIEVDEADLQLGETSLLE